ncbi:MAG TPA: AMIN domain-containing protein [Terriglobales bacterium]|nr:AMIN domain-containing protein [Terriglobales bacterium]
MKRWIYLGSILVLMALPSGAADAVSSEVRKVEVLPARDEIRVEVTLSMPVAPQVQVTGHPDRIVVKLPGAAASVKQQRISVGKLGVRSVRFGLNRPDPPETHLVIDLDQPHTYKILTEGSRITLIVEAPISLSAKRRTPPAAAASRPLISSIGRGDDSSAGQPGNQSNVDGTLLTPPPSGSPIAFPTSNSPAASTANVTSSSEQPSARHPNTASLQQGTVFPSAGSPGAGVVPPVSGTPKPNGLDTAVTQSPAAPPMASGPREANTVAEKPVPAPENAIEVPKKIETTAAIQAAATDRPEPAQAEIAPQPAETAVTPVPPAVPSTDTVVASPAPQESTEGSGQGHATTMNSSGGSDLRTAFRVKYVVQDAAYLDGGRAAGLAEGMKLVVRNLPNSGAVAAEGSDSNAAGDVAELEILSVAETSSVTEVHTPRRPIKVGDLAYLSSADQEALVEKNALSATRKYPAVVSFTEDDTLDDEARAEVPKPPLPSVNRARGRIGFDYIGTANHDGSGIQSTNLGIVLRADITRINGTYWNVSGYWRGRLNSTSGGQQTLQDLINRTYHIYTSYDNPNSSWVAGFGRMYLPWATSLDTIDGGYLGRKLSHGTTAGIFMGSTPDPTSYSYDPNREIGGGFVNFDGGSYDDLHYTSTFGGGIKMDKWSIDRPFVFAENGIFFKRIFSIYQAAQLDSAPGYSYQTNDTPPVTAYQPGTGFGIGRSFLTLRVQPHARVEFSFNHTYFRDLPTFDPTLIGTGMLDKYLFQGFSAGTRVEVYKQVWVSGDFGLSNRTGDKNNSLNQMYGVTFGRLPWVHLHADARYSRFSSAFGSGTYKAFSVSKNLGETMQLHAMFGQQNFASSLTSATNSRFINAEIETTVGRNFFLQAGGTINRGNQMNYDQWMFTFGYRFDNRHGHRGQ